MKNQQLTLVVKTQNNNNNNNNTKKIYLFFSISTPNELFNSSLSIFHCIYLPIAVCLHIVKWIQAFLIQIICLHTITSYQVFLYDIYNNSAQ